MKSITFKQLVSVAILATVAVSAVAAPSNGPKPKCPLGQIAVLKNNMWVCDEPSIKAPTKPMQSSVSQAKLKRAVPAKPERAKPDLSIANVYKLNDPTPDVASFKVYVKNTEGVASAATKMSLSSPKGGGEVTVDAIPANSGKWITVQFFNFDRGDRILLNVDSIKKINETKEDNNKYAFNW